MGMQIKSMLGIAGPEAVASLQPSFQMCSSLCAKMSSLASMLWQSHRISGSMEDASVVSVVSTVPLL